MSFHPQDLIAHMRHVQSAERDLRDLGVLWQMIESSASISCPEEVAPILPTLIETRERFDELQGRLIGRMALESRAELGDDLGAKAQCTIDILVRNLYERTADVGFLATDDEVRDFCAAPAADQEAGRTAMVARLREYQAKYSVYDDVILLGLQGGVLARIDEAEPGQAADAALAEQALSAPAYVERFGPSPLCAGGRPALLYAQRIQSAAGRLCGVLVLRFRFADEMQRIFSDVADANIASGHQLALMLMDEHQQVIASNDEAHVPVGAKLRALPSGEIALTAFAGREYLAVCCASAGYQGYCGPRWRALAMVSLLTAFRQGAEPDGPAGVDGADGSVPIDNPELLAVQAEAEAINRELRRVVWNGRLASAPAAGPGQAAADRTRLKAVLRQVTLAGGRTRVRVGQAIQDIYRTSLTRTRRQARELARLAADIMDRNLYERANDCRWWALSPVLRRVLAGPPDAAESAALDGVLEHIHSLYTVYSRLVAFDAQGVIRGASRGTRGDTLTGTAVPAHWLRAVQGLHDSQRYAVSPFEPSEMHDEGDTYVYLAAVRAPGSEAAAGGIAIVFNAAREFGAMLRDVIAQRSGFAAFIDGQGRVLASSDTGLSKGATIAFTGDAAVIEHEGAHYACARVRAGGYREFKAADGYDNQVSAVMGLRLGAAERRRESFSDLDLAPVRGGTMEVAVFQAGAMRFALPTSAVIEAISVNGLVRTPGAAHPMVGMIEWHAGTDSQMIHVACARRLFGVEHPARSTDGVVLVLRHPAAPGTAFGLRVDDVLAVLETRDDRLRDIPAGFGRFAQALAGLIDCDVAGGQGNVLLQLLSHERLAIAVGLGEPGAETSFETAFSEAVPEAVKSLDAA